MPHRRTTNKVIRPHQQTEVSHLLLSAAAGGLVGLAAALLFAPKAGSRLRQDLLDTYQDILDKGGKAASCAADYAEELKDTAASYMPRSKPKDSNLPIIIGALGGAILGTAAAYLAIPKDEEEEAHSITEKLRGASKSVADNIQSIDWIGTAKDVLSALNEKVNHNHNGSKAEPLEEIAEENNLDEILDWASLGLRVWQNIKKGANYMGQKNVKGVVAGAVIGTVLGSISALLMPKRQKLLATLKNQKKDWVEKAKDISETLMDEAKFLSRDKKEDHSVHFINGTLIGLLLGAASALLLTPKTGKQLRNNLSKKYEDISEKTQDLIEYINDNADLSALTKRPILTAKRSIATVKRAAHPKKSILKGHKLKAKTKTRH